MGVPEQGKGRKVLNNGGEYFGHVDDQFHMHGWGQLKMQNFQYQGMLSKGVFHGEGELHSLLDNKIFKGTFEKGRKVTGVETSSQGTYEGTFANDMPEG